MPKSSRKRMSKTKRKMKSLSRISNLKSKRGNQLKSAKAAKLDRIIKKLPTRAKSKTKLLMMYKEKPDFKTMYKEATKPVRIPPNRKWFGNVRTIEQKDLEKFRIELAEATKDPFKVLIAAKKLPISLLKNPLKEKRANILDIQDYGDVFGKKKTRKRPKLSNFTYEGILKKAKEQQQCYKVSNDKNLTKYDFQDFRNEVRDKRHEAGQSPRIWQELYKVLDSSDVVCIVIDARDPLGTRCYKIEKYIQEHRQFKHIVLIMNKIDLVPTSITYKWVKYLSKSFPTIAFRASTKQPFGKGQLIQLLRQFDNFHKDKKTVSVGFIGYPNVGKSSVINTIRGKKVCKSAPIPGETKVWQYIHLTKRIYLIDCPGVVHQSEGKNDVDTVLKGVVRPEKIQEVTYYINAILEKIPNKTLQKLYGIKPWTDCDDFLENIARRMGKLSKGNVPDLKAAGKIVFQDWQRGRIPCYTLPPIEEKKE